MGRRRRRRAARAVAARSARDPVGGFGRGRSGADPIRRRAAADTTYLCTVDGRGMGVSLIQSNAAGFGSHLFEPGTGINLHNRGIGFSLVPGHPAEYGPGRRPPHTLSPALVTRPDGELHAVLGTQGGDGQPQILLQVLARLLHADQSPGRAIASRRWVLTGLGSGLRHVDGAGRTHRRRRRRCSPGVVGRPRGRRPHHDGWAPPSTTGSGTPTSSCGGPTGCWRAPRTPGPASAPRPATEPWTRRSSPHARST